MQPTTEIHKTAEQIGPWSLLWKVSDAGPGNRKKPLRMLGNYSKKASVISLPPWMFHQTPNLFAIFPYPKATSLSK